MPEHDLYLCGGAQDADWVGALAEALRSRGWRVFDALAPAEPGRDVGATRARALSDSAWLVVVTSAPPSLELRSQIAAAIESRRADPLGVRVLPVRRVDERLGPEWDVLPMLQEVITDDPAVAAARIHAVAELRGLRGWGAARARVAVIAAMAELAAAVRRIAEILSGMKSQVAEVVEVDLADPGALERADGCLLRLVLLGGCTAGEAGRARLELLLGQGTRTVLAVLDPVPNEVARRFRTDLAHRMDLLDLAGPLALPFASIGDLARLRDPLAERLAALLPDPGQGKVVLEPWERFYLEHHARGWEEGRIGGLSEMARRRLERAPLYVSLHAGEGRWRRDKDGRVTLQSQYTSSDWRPPAPVFLDELLSHPLLPSVVVVGEAGTGKTVLLQHVAWSLCCHHRGDPPPSEHRLDLNALTQGLPYAPVPIWIEARQLANEISQGGPDGALERLMCRTFGVDHAPAARRPPADAIASGLEFGRYLLLLDALDEVPGQRARDALVELLTGLRRTSKCRVVLTTRPTAFTALKVPDGYERVDIAPLDEDRRQAMLERWRTVLGIDEAAVRELDRALAWLGTRFGADGLGRNPLDNPLLLTTVLLVHLEQRRLPDNLADLYERMVRHLCDRRPDDPDAREDERDRTSAERRDLLTRVALALQEQEARGVALSVNDLAARLVTERRARDRAEATASLNRLSDSTALLRFEDEHGEQVVRPWHRSFQEYLAATALAGRGGAESNVVADLARPTQPGQLAPLLDPSWEGCLRFATGAFGHTGRARAVGWVQALLDEATRDPDPAREGRLLGLAATGVAEYEREYFRDDPVRSTILRHVVDRFLAADGAWPWRDRHLALTAVGRLGDPRLPDPRRVAKGWVALPTEPRCWLRRWPVTVAEYGAFLEDPTWRSPRWWTESPPVEPRTWEAQVHVPNAPVVEVSWYAARAFCRWANELWVGPSDEGSFDLPDSREWASAALLRAGPYPWGTADPGRGNRARANFGWGPNGPQAPTPVGLFNREGDGQFLDLAGNVWEWCGNDYRYDISGPFCALSDQPESHLPRELRGGSWQHGSFYLRTDARDGIAPSESDRCVGFRVVFRAPAGSERAD